MKEHSFSAISLIASLLAAVTILGSGCASNNTPPITTAKTTSTQSQSTTTSPDVLPPDTLPATIPSTTPSVEFDEAENARFEKFLSDLFLNEVSLDTLTLHFTIKDKAKYGLDNLEVRWEADEEDDKFPFDEVVKTLDGFDPAKLSSENSLNLRILKAYVSQSAEMGDEKYEYLGTYFDTGSGVHIAITTNLSEYEFYRQKDIDDFITLIDQLPDLFEEMLEFEGERVEKGYGMTDEVLDLVIEQCRAISDTEGDLYLVDVVREKFDKIDFIDDAAKKDYVEKIRTTINNNMIPAYKKAVATLESFKGKAKNEFGLCGFEGGKEYYELLAKQASSTSMSCDEMIRALEADYSALYNELMDLYNDAEFVNGYSLYKGYPIGISKPEEVLEFLRNKIKADFPTISGESYEIDYLSEAMQSVMSGTVAYYVTPYIDDYLHGKMKINGSNMTADDALSTLAHEGFPGHMYQHVYYLSGDPAPIRTLLSFPGYTEGWAVYAGNYAYTLYGFDDYSNSLAQKIIRYYVINERIGWNAECRMDIGIHYEGWTVGQLKQYLDENGLNSSGAAEIYDQLLGMPATFLSYYVGYLEIERLADYAKNTLGDKFSLVEFHKAVLDVGPCTMDFVEESVMNYVNSKK